MGRIGVNICTCSLALFGLIRIAGNECELAQAKLLLQHSLRQLALIFDSNQTNDIKVKVRAQSHGLLFNYFGAAVLFKRAPRVHRNGKRQNSVESGNTFSSARKKMLALLAKKELGIKETGILKTKVKCVVVKKLCEIFFANKF